MPRPQGETTRGTRVTGNSLKSRQSRYVKRIVYQNIGRAIQNDATRVLLLVSTELGANSARVRDQRDGIFA